MTALVTVPETVAIAPTRGFEAPSSIYQSLCFMLCETSVRVKMGNNWRHAVSNL